MSYSDKTAIWFHKPTMMNQPLFQVPLLGYITGSQGLLLFGVGLPAFFLVMNSYGPLAALAPLAGAAALAMIRPPVLGYEGRLAVAAWFYLARGRSGQPAKSRAFSIPVPTKAGAIPRKARLGRRAKAAPAPVEVRATGRPVEISLSLRHQGQPRKPAQGQDPAGWRQHQDGGPLGVGAGQRGAPPRGLRRNPQDSRPRGHRRGRHRGQG